MIFSLGSEALWASAVEKFEGQIVNKDVTWIVDAIFVCFSTKDDCINAWIVKQQFRTYFEWISILETQACYAIFYPQNQHRSQLLSDKNASRRPFAMSIFWTIISSAYKKQKTFDQQTPTGPPNKKPEIYSRNQGPCLLFYPSFFYISPDIERHRFIFAT